MSSSVATMSSSVAAFIFQQFLQLPTATTKDFSDSILSEVRKRTSKAPLQLRKSLKSNTTAPHCSSHNKTAQRIRAMAYLRTFPGGQSGDGPVVLVPDLEGLLQPVQQAVREFRHILTFTRFSFYSQKFSK